MIGVGAMGLPFQIGELSAMLVNRLEPNDG
jgi:hypothetical protein